MKNGQNFSSSWRETNSGSKNWSKSPNNNAIYSWVVKNNVGNLNECTKTGLMATITHTHTTVLLLCWNLSGTTRVSRYQKGKTRKVKTNLDLLEQESEWQWHLLGYMQVCTSSQTTTPTSHHSVFYRPDALPAAQPTVSKHKHAIILFYISLPNSFSPQVSKSVTRSLLVIPIILNFASWHHHVKERDLSDSQWLTMQLFASATHGHFTQ